MGLESSLCCAKSLAPPSWQLQAVKLLRGWFLQFAKSTQVGMSMFPLLQVAARKRMQAAQLQVLLRMTCPLL
jgi:hypothetical protein